MKTNNQIILKKKKGQWWNIATNKSFSGLASVNGQTFLYTKDGRKIPQSKPAPNIHNFIKNLWMRENPENKGFTNGKYYYYQTTNGNWDIGPGIDKAKQTDAFNKRAVRGFTPTEMNAEVMQRAKNTFAQVDKALKTVTQFPDTVSPQIKEGLADIRYQTGPLVSNYPKLLKAVATGNVKDMAKESKVYFWDNKKKAMSFDKKRFDTRMKENFHYRNGGHLSRKVLRQLSEDFRPTNRLV